MKRITARIFLGLVALLISSVACHAQFTASVQGTVQDPKGAVVPNATVTLMNIDTGVRQTATSNADGVYLFPSLAPGNYTVSTTVSGFAPDTVSFDLTTNQVRNVPLTLAVEQASSTITVTTQAPLLDTSDSRLEQTLDTTALTDLPLPGRNPTNVITIAPGVTGTGGQASPGTANSTNFAPENWVNASANGRGANGNQYVVDGLDVTSSIRPGVINLTPNADTVQEVSVQTNTYTVDYGRASSIQTVMTTKSGSNEFHGIASEYYTYQGLTARGEFGVPQPTPLNPYHVNNMSFALGGPVIPHKQFFFFVGYEPYLSLSSNGSSLVSYEAPEFLSFAQSVQPNSPEVQLMAKYPASGATTAGVQATAGQLWSNVLPQQDQASCEAGVGNLPDSYDDIPCATPVFDNGHFNSSSYYNAKQYNIRLDKYFSKDRIYGNFYRSTVDNGGPSVRPAFATTSAYYVFSLQANETHTFSPNMLNEAIWGYNRIEGISPKTGLYTVPIVSVNQLGTGWGDGFADGDYIQHSYHWRDVLTRVVGSHSFKAGFEGWRGDDIALFAGAYAQPNLYYQSMIDLINDNPYSETGLAYNPVSGQPAVRNYGYKETTLGIFAEDTWKANRKLTVNYGIRYDNYGNPYVALKGTVLANLHLGSGSNIAEQIANASMVQQSHVFNHDINWVFSPRVGVAYDPFGNGKWVARGGFGVFHDYVTLGNAENDLGSNPPGPVVPTFYNNGSTAAPIFGYGTQNSYPFGFEYPAFQGQPLDAKGGIPGSQIGVAGNDVNLSAPITFNWSAALERQISSNITASVGYTGTHSQNLIVVGGNTGDTSYTVDLNLMPGDLIQHPVFDGSGNWTGTGTQTRLNTSFGSMGYEYNAARQNYYAFIAAVKGRFARHGFLTASYTHSASKDNSGNYPEGYVASGGTSYDIDQWYSPSSWDVPNRVSLGWSYDIPGMAHGNGFTRRVTNGFTLAGVTVLQSGTPFSVFNTNALSLVDTAGTTVTQANYATELAAGNIDFAPNSGNYSADGDYNNPGDIPDVTSYHQKHDRKAYQYTGVVDSGVITHSQFAQPAFKAAGTEGNEKLGEFRNPGYADTDFTIKKSTVLAERFNLELRLDIFNIFNRVNLNGVNTNYGDASAGFGTTSSNMPPRNMQVAARFTF
ncbi:MAG TPA: carboxypeptidase regulatory-like domain-containing protein [Terracidiphilus sp.]|nr:carboxypeptidase regulatory-like domain-containing protein [Terracidiphilus sp.]